MLNICEDLFNVTNLFLSSLTGIKRIDESIFPSLKLKKNILRPPEHKLEPKIMRLQKMIASILNYSRERPSD